MLQPQLAYFPQFIFNLRRSQFVQVGCLTSTSQGLWSPTGVNGLPSCCCSAACLALQMLGSLLVCVAHSQELCSYAATSSLPNYPSIAAVHRHRLLPHLFAGKPLHSCMPLSRTAPDKTALSLIHFGELQPC